MERVDVMHARTLACLGPSCSIKSRKHSIVCLPRPFPVVRRVSIAPYLCDSGSPDLGTFRVGPRSPRVCGQPLCHMMPEKKTTNRLFWASLIPRQPRHATPRHSLINTGVGAVWGAYATCRCISVYYWCV